ncbi:hypothetical protein B0J13DRAFT_460833 [Dactylonectria estremocensis]|uniref:Uncharacterized protein n=1 Tax=Dactylonectria estremocensis TaxID=1079267 RepID=A0A9P9D6W2_9HYPO|nr:hypothetical protein B0J13DRAFT_460833 [Dactylonectria estremocensis]
MESIDTPQMRKLWNDVQEKPEWATTRFWEYVFKQYRPPTDDDDDLRRVDLVVENFDDNGNSTTLLFMEAKRANATRDQIEDVEYQAFTACCAHLFSTAKPTIWAMTCVGSKARLWAYRLKDNYITPFWPPGDGLSAMSEYAEFSTDIIQQLKFIKNNPIPSVEIFSNPPSPRPASATLPHNWHDREVAYTNASAGPSSSSAFQPDPAGQSQPESAYQGLVVDSSIAVQTTVDKYENNNYKCTRASDNRRFYVPGGAWVECQVQISGALYPGFCWTADSGTQYYTWSLEPTQGPSKRRK